MTKLCVDCEHHKRYLRVHVDADHKCHHPSVVVEDVVTGELVPKTCEEIRRSLTATLCGPKAKLWERRLTLWELVCSYLLENSPIGRPRYNFECRAAAPPPPRYERERPPPTPNPQCGGFRDHD